MDPEGRRRILGVSAALSEALFEALFEALSEAEMHWRAFMDSLIERGLRGVEFVASDDHAGLRAARRAVLPGASWQRCQFHLAQNAIHHAPSLATARRVGAELRAVWNARDLHAAKAELARLVETCAESAPRLAAWLEADVPEGLAVFASPEHHRRRTRTSNPIERGVQQKIKRRTQRVRVLPNKASLLRPVTAVLVEINEERATTDRVHITMHDQDE